jgi:hypothetical protein
VVFFSFRRSEENPSFLSKGGENKKREGEKKQSKAKKE